MVMWHVTLITVHSKVSKPSTVNFFLLCLFQNKNEGIAMQENVEERYGSHLTHLIRKVDTIIDSESRPTEKDIVTLTNSMEQFNECTAFLQEVDQEIANTITGEDELEAEIIESAAIQEVISDKISLIKRILNRLTTPVPPTTLSMSAAEFLPPPPPTGTVSTPL